jgi:O-antigen/teichoic acid export membrane protein
MLWFAAPYLVNSASAVLVIPLAAGDCICNKIAECAGQVFQTFEQLRVTATLAFVGNLCRCLIAVGLFLILHRASAWQWAVASLAVSLVGAVIPVTAVTIKYGWPRFRLKLFCRTLGEGFGYSLAGSTAVIYNDVDKTMLSHAGMNAANGIYSMAYRVIEIATMPILSIHMAARPRYFQRGALGVETTAELSRKILKRTAVLGVMMAAGTFIAAPLIPHLVGHDFTDAVSALRWLCLIPCLRAFHFSSGEALMGAGFQRYRTTAQLMAAGVNIVLNVQLIPIYGWKGAAWASLLTDASLAALNWAGLAWVRNRANLVLAQQARG